MRADLTRTLCICSISLLCCPSSIVNQIATTFARWLKLQIAHVQPARRPRLPHWAKIRLARFWIGVHPRCSDSCSLFQVRSLCHGNKSALFGTWWSRLLPTPTTLSQRDRPCSFVLCTYLPGLIYVQIRRNDACPANKILRDHQGMGAVSFNSGTVQPNQRPE
ncbi:hypothetical protein F4680DRAFT_314990 [Xylaria scruposa]|nr:hypothetical protein F4680DRAFT_314990 [Xylaria scruposa]